MTIDEAIKLKQKYQYILQDASLLELIEADNLSIEALKRVKGNRSTVYPLISPALSGETKD